MEKNFSKPIGSTFPREDPPAKNEKHRPTSDKRPATGGSVGIDKLGKGGRGISEKGANNCPG